ncbi:LacI family DNA-binding transcriptional regulator [Saccharibacillus alkalitolerans]|uniref:LacI family DNA-binding transcriptional regulator n=1 Tax=Saccharibacillus alkalitolerans TaxID=2705290 RepID=UPI001F420F21|nr:LacI family DNA-binding transcriptional regulator [Saccharibacillus alkalitolerans]
MPNLEEIAKLSGFSKATVSRVLNKSRHVSPETREKILRVIREMDYVPNRNAVSLSKGRTMQIGMITAGITEVILPFMTSFVEAAAEHGFQTIIYTSDSDRQRELQAFEDLKQKRVDGLLIITCVNDLSVVSSYGKYGPIVSWQRMDRPDIPSVAMDQYDGYKLAVEHLLSLGVTKIANAFGRPSSLNTQRRIQAYEDLMEERGLEIRRDWYFKSVYHLEDGQAVVRRLLGAPEENSGASRPRREAAAGEPGLLEAAGRADGEEAREGGARSADERAFRPRLDRAASPPSAERARVSAASGGGPGDAAYGGGDSARLREAAADAGDRRSEFSEPPQAIVCANDYVAAGVLSEARRLRWSVPERLRIVSFDNMQIAGTLGLTSVQNPIRDQAYNAFALLSPRLLGRQIPLKPLAFGLNVRETT